MLYSKGIFINRCFDELNLSMPALVKEIHEGYVQAGAELIETNTFGANAFRLGPYGFVEKLLDINRAAVRLAGKRPATTSGWRVPWDPWAYASSRSAPRPFRKRGMPSSSR